MSQVPERKIYDNDVTFLYKWAIDHDLPVRLVISERDKDLVTLPSLVERMVEEGESPLSIYRAVTSNNRQITQEDFIMV